MEYQLRIYRVRDGELDAFVEEWRTGVAPLRRKLGFHIVGAWVDAEASRFVWVVGYDGPEGLEAAAQAYYDSPERRAMADPARHLEQIDVTAITSVVA